MPCRPRQPSHLGQPQWQPLQQQWNLGVWTKGRPPSPGIQWAQATPQSVDRLVVRHNGLGGEREVRRARRLQRWQEQPDHLPEGCADQQQLCGDAPENQEGRHTAWHWPPRPPNKLCGHGRAQAGDGRGEVENMMGDEGRRQGKCGARWGPAPSRLLRHRECNTGSNAANALSHPVTSEQV
jgi:hypothetical protein